MKIIASDVSILTRSVTAAFVIPDLATAQTNNSEPAASPWQPKASVIEKFSKRRSEFNFDEYQQSQTGSVEKRTRQF